MINPEQFITNIKSLNQLCYVVYDVEKTVEFLWNQFHIGPWVINSYNADSMISAAFYGKPTRFGFKVALTIENHNGMQIEVVQPLEGKSTFSEFLEKNGEGIHHLGWHRLDTFEAFNQNNRAMENAGITCIMDIRLPIGAVAFFDTTKFLKAQLEVVWFDPSVKTPFPQQRIFPLSKT